MTQIVSGKMKNGMPLTRRNKGIRTHFEIIFDYLAFKNRGMVLAKGSGTVRMMPESYYAEAYHLGKSI